jgi:fumarate reductase flavoprotein subunit
LLWVNKNGERFITEDDAGPFNGGNAIAIQPDNIAFVLFDAATVQRIAQRGGLRGSPLRNAPLAAQRGPLPNLHEELVSKAEAGRMKISDSLREIAHWIGADPAILKASIDEYNAACNEGYDRLFAKHPENLIPVREPPFYALKCSSGFLDTIGGIKINERMEVVSKAGKSIPGLYAAGVITGGLARRNLLRPFAWKRARFRAQFWAYCRRKCGEVSSFCARAQRNVTGAP